MSGLQEAGYVRTRHGSARHGSARHGSARHGSAETSAAHPDVRIGVIGAGRIGKIHAENLTQRVRGAYVRTRTSSSLSPTRGWRLPGNSPAACTSPAPWRTTGPCWPIRRSRPWSSVPPPIRMRRSSRRPPRFASTSFARSPLPATCPGLTRPWMSSLQRASSYRSGSTAGLTRAFCQLRRPHMSRRRAELANAACARWWPRARSASPTSCTLPAATRSHHPSRMSASPAACSWT